MPMLATSNTSPLIRQTRERLQKEGIAQAKREFWFKVKFCVCLPSAVAIGTFLYVALIF